jgi:uncharacterized protein
MATASDVQPSVTPSGAAPVTSSPITTLSAPVDQAERISALDTVRGFALLGILLMNIIAMGMFGGAYDDPMAAGGSTGPNLWVWTAMHILAEGKMRCLFSMVFGAGIILLTSRIEKRGASSADIYYRRTLWLLLFGIIHAYFLWLGDILYGYALCALVLFPFRKMSAKGLLTIGAIFVLLNSALYIGGGFHYREVITDGQAAVEASNQGKKLTEKEEGAKREYEGWRKGNRPTPEELKKDADAWRGNFFSVVGARAKEVLPGHSQPYYSPLGGNWDIWCMMFIGMGLFKLGVLTGERSMRFYALMVLIGYGIGLPLNSYSAWLIIKSHFDPVIHFYANSSYDVGRLTVALGHMGVIMLLCKAGVFQWLTSALGAVGQMAFTNYISQSVITAFYFTGYGFKMYGKLERYQLYYVVGAIWIFQLIVSPIWMRHFRFGPLEWCWRSLTYWHRQPMRRTAPAVETGGTQVRVASA